MTVRESRRVSHNERLDPEELRAFMNLHGISSKELSEIFGVSQVAVHFWLTGEREMTITNSRLIRLFERHPKLIGEF